YAHRIQRPLLIGQGANDPRVKQSESDQIVAAMQEAGIPVTYVLYPDEGHGFVRPPNRLSFSAVQEAFFHEHLGGRFEPFGDDFEGSSITDRKSTRLNSSHVKISYAVFCLKKKKKTAGPRSSHEPARRAANGAPA